MTYDESDVRWSPWWIAIWIVSCWILVWLLAAGASPTSWFTAFLLLFLVPELIGLRRHRDALPPLTYVVRRYVKRWIPDAVTFGVGAWMAMAWIPVAHHPTLVAVAIAGMVGWLFNHWDVTYS